MRQCAGTTKKGVRCRITVPDSSRFCAIHEPAATPPVLGAVLGALGGLASGKKDDSFGVLAIRTLVGGVLGAAADYGVRQVANVGLPALFAKRVFLSFDYDNDLALKHFMVGQAKNEKSPFTIVDSSLQEAKPEREWVQHAIEAIRETDLVMVMVGRHTHRARGVLIEVEIARRLGVKCVQIRGYRDRVCTPVRGAGRLYDWNWDKLDEILA